MARALCNAFVSPETDSEEEIEYTVEVEGLWDHSEIKTTYLIKGKTERAAAMEGIRRFQEENE